MINGHGNNIYQFDSEAIEVDFSSNIAYNHHSARIIDFLKQNISAINNYPDPEARTLTNRLASEFQVSDAQVLVANGSAEIFYLLAHYFSRCGKVRSVITVPSFSEYEDACRLYDHALSFKPLRDLQSLDLSQTDSVWLGSPNNPDGFRVAMEDLISLAKANSHCYFVVDRAYNELSSEVETQSVDLPENLILIDSFTKVYAIPGLRLGYVIANCEIIKAISTMRPPWSVNALSLLVGEYILDNKATLQPDVQTLISESQALQKTINELDSYKVSFSNCNFFLVEILNGKTASELQKYLVSEHKMLIRDASNFRTLSDKFFRVATQGEANNKKLIQALRQWK